MVLLHKHLQFEFEKKMLTAEKKICEINIVLKSRAILSMFATDFSLYKKKFLLTENQKCRMSIATVQLNKRKNIKF